ncbi:UNVERIFIED_CONTAM: Pectin acetylesterase 5 [Sesamum indicum]
MPANHHRLPRSSVDGGFSWWWWWRKLSKREWTIFAAAAAFSIFLIILSPVSVSRAFTNTSANSGTASCRIIAVCLDGSVPGYHIRRGFGSGSDSWLLHVEGGGWCSTLSSCSARRRTKLGSSTYMEHEVEFLGILSHDPLHNPDFFNWNKVKLRYCDGSSFSSHPHNEFGNGTKIFFRGQLIWDTVMDELLSIGMTKAREQPVHKFPFFRLFLHDVVEIIEIGSSRDEVDFLLALLTGCSAGGLATLIHCDDFRGLLPKDANVKCLADAGFFLNEYVLYSLSFSLFDCIFLLGHLQLISTTKKDISCPTYIRLDTTYSMIIVLLTKYSNLKRFPMILHAQQVALAWGCLASKATGKDIAGNHTIESFYHDVVHLQGVAKSLNHDCVTRSEPYKCFFPQEFIGNIKTPIFLVQPAYDFWQIANILVPASSDPGGSWPRCKLNILKCDSSQLEVLHGYRNSLLKTLNEFQQNPEMGMFINSCFVHCQTWAAETWHSPTSPRINNKFRALPVNYAVLEFRVGNQTQMQYMLDLSLDSASYITSLIFVKQTVAESVGDWYFKRAAAKQIDCPYPCNPTCYNMDLTRG